MEVELDPLAMERETCPPGGPLFDPATAGAYVRARPLATVPAIRIRLTLLAESGSRGVRCETRSRVTLS